eukprot:PhF_6_TR19979/c0_g1_i1/m.29144
MDFVDYYRILNVPRTADTKLIERAYRKCALHAHPDKVVATSTTATTHTSFHELTEAYRCLQNPELRKEYDAKYDNVILQSLRHGDTTQHTTSNNHTGIHNNPHRPSAVLEGMLEAVRSQERHYANESKKWEDLFQINRDGSVQRRKDGHKRPSSCIPSTFGVSSHSLKGKVLSTFRDSTSQRSGGGGGTATTVFSRPTSAIGTTMLSIPRPQSSMERKPPVPLRPRSTTSAAHRTPTTTTSDHHLPPPCPPRKSSASLQSCLAPSPHLENHTTNTGVSGGGGGDNVTLGPILGNGLSRPSSRQCPLPRYVSPLELHTQPRTSSSSRQRLRSNSANFT